MTPVEIAEAKQTLAMSNNYFFFRASLDPVDLQQLLVLAQINHANK